MNESAETAAGAVKTPRQRAREQAIRDIKRLALEQMAERGGAGLSLRAIARELGIVSSAVYRYVPSRDELLTLLIADAYNSLGAAAERADAACDRADLAGRWMAIGRAVRHWAVRHPVEYALLYGGPIPGYAAPPDQTIGPGTRVMALLAQLFAAIGRSAAGQPAAPFPCPCPGIPDALHRDLRAVREEFGIEVDDDLLARGLLAWTSLFGLLSFELFGQFRGGVQDNAAHFEHQLARLAILLGLEPS